MAPDDGGIGQLFRGCSSDTVVTGIGRVLRILPDDNDGSRHQRLIVEVPGGITVLVAHNIDLAPRVPCQLGEEIRFRGEYEWSEQGGTVHWTHDDPRDWHADGWIEFDGKRYE